MRRRDFITLVGGTAIARPIEVLAQQSERPRRIGILHDYPKDDPEGVMQITAFREELAKLGWIEDRKLMAQSRHHSVKFQCPLLGVKRTSPKHG